MKKIGESFKGIVGGVILIIVGICILWWNEGNNVKNLKTTSEMQKQVIDISSDKIDSTNEGKLVATHGKLVNEQVMNDDTFGVSVTTPKLVRVVEMYQWEEEEHEDDDDNKTYTYKKVWSDEIIDSSEFHDGTHANPGSMPYSSDKFLSSDVKVGAFSLNSKQIESLSTNKNYTDLKEEVATRLNYQIYNNYYVSSVDYNNPQIGDVRVSFNYNDSTDISILAVQSGNSFTEFTSSVGKTESRVMDGNHSGKEMIEVIKRENKFIKWIFRLLGVLLVTAGFGAILKPISVIGGVVPILGSIVEGMVGLVSFILGLSLSLVVIAIAWIRFRPLLGIGLLVAVGALIYFLKTKTKKEAPNTPATPITANQPTTPTPEQTPVNPVNNSDSNNESNDQNQNM